MYLVQAAANELVRRHPLPAKGQTPPGFRLELPGRGTTFVTDTGGPAGAPVLVLLHGAASTGLLNWYPSIDALSAQFRVITMDQRGHGDGIRTPRLTIEDCADDVASLVTTLGLGEAFVMGHSMGSVVAQEVWHRHPDQVAGLVLCSTTECFRSSAAAMLFFGGVEASILAARVVRPWTMPSGKRAGMRSRRSPDPTLRWVMAEWHKNRPAAVAQAVVACGRHDSTPWISQIDVPTAVVVTMQDSVIDPERQRALAAQIPGATIHEVDGGHSACISDAEQFVPVAVEAAVLTAQRAGCLPVRRRRSSERRRVGPA